MNIHVRRKLAQSLVEVIHLRENAAHDHDDEDIGRGMCELVVSRECHLQRDAEGFDEHDRDRASCGADGEVDEWVLAAMFRGDLVDHEDGEDGNEEAVDEETCNQSAVCQDRLSAI